MRIRTATIGSIVPFFALAAVLLTACESTEQATPPSIIVIESGNDQYSKKGTDLPLPLVVKVQYPDRTNAADVPVRFTAIEGAGSVSPSTAQTDGRGTVTAHCTLGPDVGTNRIRAELVDDRTKFVVFDATALDYYCPEEDPTFVRKFPSRGSGPYNDLFLFTRESGVNTSGDETVAGVVRLMIDGDSLQTSSLIKFEEVFSRIVPRDASFAHSGDFYLSRMHEIPEVMKVSPVGPAAHHFATLETYRGGEITSSAAGVLVGCDEYGPFIVGCRDTLQRFEEATYSGVEPDMANDDAVAVDTNPQNEFYEDVYFIDLSDNTLRRLPLDSLTASGPTEIVTQLTGEEAAGTNGMACNNDGTVYLLVDTEDIKAIFSVTPAGEKNTEYDFFDRGTGDAAGIQNDLAIRQGRPALLFTVDTLNDLLLLYVPGQGLSELFPRAGFDPESISSQRASGERIGLVWLP
jgi:hypothetical protein